MSCCFLTGIIKGLITKLKLRLPVFQKGAFERLDSCVVFVFILILGVRSLGPDSGLGLVRRMCFCSLVFDLLAHAANISSSASTCVCLSFWLCKRDGCLLFPPNPSRSDLSCVSTHTQVTGELLPRLMGLRQLTITLAHSPFHFPLSAPCSESLRRNRKMARPSSCQQRDARRRCRRKSCPWWTARASACRGATSSPSSLALASASLLVFGVTWAWPSSAWSTATPPTETTKRWWW